MPASPAPPRWSADPTVRVDGGLLDAAGDSLRVVANFAVGYDNIDVGACRQRGVVVTNTPDVLTNATAELALGLMLAAARRLGEGERMVRAGRWTGWEPGQLLGRELSGSVVGIVGLGRIGTRVAELLRGFDVTLLCASRSPHPELESRLEAERVSLEELLARADFVTLHVPLSAETRRLIDDAALDRMKPGAVLVNTSRGGLVDSTALARALRDGRLFAAGLDVYDHEPDVPAELLALENVVLAPHMGSATSQARDGMARLVAQNVAAVLAGRDAAHSSIDSRRRSAFADPSGGLIRTRSTASGSNDGLVWYVSTASPYGWFSWKFPAPPPPTVPPFSTTTPSDSTSSCSCVWPVRKTSGAAGGVARSSSSARAASAGACTITTSIRPTSGRSQRANARCWSSVTSGSRSAR